MPSRNHPLSLVPTGLHVERCAVEPTGIVILACSPSPAARCPRCATPSTSVHSRYQRAIRDLPIQGRDSPSAEAALLVAQVTKAAPALVAARDLLDCFHAMIRTRRPELLDGWLEAARASELTSFANGLAADQAAV